MSYTAADFESATAKLATLEFTEAETEAIAAFLNADHGDVAGFGKDQNRGTGFLLEVAGIMPTTKGFSFGVEREFTAPGDVAGYTATDDLFKNK